MTDFEQPTQPIRIVASTRAQEISQQRYERLKRTADVTGKRLLFVYLEEEKKRLRAEYQR